MCLLRGDEGGKFDSFMSKVYHWPEPQACQLPGLALKSPMDKRHLFLALALAMGGAAWWHFGHPGWLTNAQKRQQFEQKKAAQEAAKPKLYRWHDAQGRLQLTDKAPPKGVKFERVDLDTFQNTIHGDRPETGE
jgi:Domain of unknown function (DUF4124)